jgi:hypothetical protein
LVRYAEAVDSRRFALLDDVFLPEASFGRDPPVTGRTEIVAFITNLIGRCGPTQHLLGNESVLFTADGAHVRCAVRALHRGAADRAELTYEMLGDYHDVFVQTEDQWRIASRWLDARIRSGPRDLVLGLDLPR